MIVDGGRGVDLACLVTPPQPRGPQRDSEVRRLHDLLRAAVLRLRTGDELPSEAALTADHNATRGTVREALRLLRDEGLIRRRQGLGTHAVTRTHVVGLEEAHGTITPSRESLLNMRMRARVLARELLPAPPIVAARLEIPRGEQVLLLEYVSLVDEEPIALATNYVAEPEASRIATAPFAFDWYALLDAAGVRLGDSEFVWDAVAADATRAALLGVDAGQPLIGMEQVVHDPAGRPFNLAFIHLRGDRYRLASRFWRQSP